MELISSKKYRNVKCKLQIIIYWIILSFHITFANWFCIFVRNCFLLNTLNMIAYHYFRLVIQFLRFKDVRYNSFRRHLHLLLISIVILYRNILLWQNLALLLILCFVYSVLIGLNILFRWHLLIMQNRNMMKIL